jgi:hypothetical protein
MPAADLVLLALELDLPPCAILACVRRVPPVDRFVFWSFRAAWRAMRDVQ